MLWNEKHTIRITQLSDYILFKDTPRKEQLLSKNYSCSLWHIFYSWKGSNKQNMHVQISGSCKILKKVSSFQSRAPSSKVSKILPSAQYWPLKSLSHILAIYLTWTFSLNVKCLVWYLLYWNETLNTIYVSNYVALNLHQLHSS